MGLRLLPKQTHNTKGVSRPNNASKKRSLGSEATSTIPWPMSGDYANIKRTMPLVPMGSSSWAVGLRWHGASAGGQRAGRVLTETLAPPYFGKKSE